MSYANARAVSAVVFLLLLLGASTAFAHGGRTNSEGCHNDRRNGGYHCHGGRQQATPRRAAPQPFISQSGGPAYSNCTAARNAGAAPVYRGDPGYGSHLDRDNDGVGCE